MEIEDSEELVREQYLSLRQQIPLMYLLMTINSAFLAIVASRDLEISISFGVPLVLTAITAVRAIVWMRRRGEDPPLSLILRRMRGTEVAAAILSFCFGCWGLALFTDADPMRASSIALYIFVGAIGACYSLQALPNAARLVLLLGAAPVTLRMLMADDKYLVGTGLTFLLAASIIVRTLSKSAAAFAEVLRSRTEMGELVLALEHSQEHHRFSVDLNPQIPWISNPDGSVREISPRWSMMTGIPIEGALGAGWLDAVHPDDLPELLERWTAALTSAQTLVADGRYRMRQADDSYRWVRARCFPRRGPDGEVLLWYGNIEDIDEQVTAELALRRAAYLDPLTGLGNRASFSEDLDRALGNARFAGSSVAVVVVDVDSFKAINDSRGHAAGDAVLQAIATRITNSLPLGAKAARIGGDEFALVIEDPSDESAWETIVRDILDHVCLPLVYDESVLEIAISAGGAEWPRDGADSEAVIKSADLALYAAKAEGSGGLTVFQPNLRRAAEARNAMLRDARNALREDRIVPFYQPKISLSSGELIGFEALLRWQDPARGLQTPGTIKAAFDDHSLSIQLTDRMLDRVLADMASWRRSGLDLMRIAINGSAADFRRDDFAERILARMDALDLCPSFLEIEITESVFLEQVAAVVERALLKLRSRGVTIALDDFGTGYASLTHLQRFPVDAVKIDQSFVAHIDQPDSPEWAIVHGVVDIARRMGVSTVAEGIETAAQLEKLRELGCDVGQGYLLGRPMADAQASHLMRKSEQGASRRVLSLQRLMAS